MGTLISVISPHTFKGMRICIVMIFINDKKPKYRNVWEKRKPSFAIPSISLVWNKKKKENAHRKYWS